MTTRVATSGRHANVRRRLSQIKLSSAAPLCVCIVVCACIVAATLAAITSPARAEAATHPLDNGPLALSGTISYTLSYSVTGPCTGCRTSESLSVSMAVAGRAISGPAGDPGPDWDNPDVYRCVLAATAGNKCFWAPLTVETASAHYRFASQAAPPGGCRAQVTAMGSYKAASTPSPLGLDVVIYPGGASEAGEVQPPPAPLPGFGSNGPSPPQSYRVTGNVAVQMAMTYTNRVAAVACGLPLPTSILDLPIDFQGSYRPGETAIRGTTSYRAIGSPRVAWDFSLKATGLDITSPTASSIIALTDGHYLTPQPGPDQIAPPDRELAVSGTDTSPGASVVRIGNVPGRIARDGTWSLRLPVTGAGKKTLAVRDNVSATATEQVTLVDLVITNPTEGAVLPISSAPAMPRLGAVATVQGYPGNVSPVVFNWALSTRGEYRDRCGHNPDAFCGQWYPYNDVVASGTTTGSAPWQGDFTRIEGGFGRVSVSADVPGVLDEPVQSEPRWVDIPGTNPPVTTIKAFVSKQDPANASVEDEIFCHESGFVQFNPYPEPREPATTTVPHAIAPNPAPLRPLFGAEYAGVGIAQKDPSSFPAQQWDWHANVDSGITVYDEDLAVARGWRQAEQVRLSAELTAVLQVVNRLRSHRGMKLVRAVPLRVPPLNTAQLQREAIRRYNGENEYHFNLHYVASSNHLMVKTVGKGKWVEGAGEWQDFTDWQADGGGPLAARQWIPAQDPGYVTLVKACHL